MPDGAAAPRPVHIDGPLRARLRDDQAEIEHLTIRMDDETRAPYFENIRACIAEYDALRGLETAVGELLDGGYFTGVTAAKFRSHIGAIEEARNRGR